nr:MAG TPA: hypothetical protein [Caudoviricetes sp.]DAQ57282.1 MAG TPA: hypothetical protein [Bacteriophage sp.]
MGGQQPIHSLLYNVGGWKVHRLKRVSEQPLEG